MVSSSKINKKLDVNSFYESQGFAVTDHDYGNENRFKKITELIKEMGSDKKRLKILDVGCGEGGYLHFLKNLLPNNTYHGCDISKNIIAYNEKNPDNKKQELYFFVADFNKKLDIKNKYDIVVAGEIIEHLENTDNFFINSRNLLNDGGTLIVTTPNLASWLDRLMLLFGWQPFSTEVSCASRIFGRKGFYKLFGIEDSPAAGHLRLYTPEALKDLGKFHGFLVTKHTPYYQQNRLPNILVSRLFKNLAEGIIMVFVKNAKK